MTELRDIFLSNFTWEIDSITWTLYLRWWGFDLWPSAGDLGQERGADRTGVRPNSWPMFNTIICYYRALFCSFFIAQQCWHLIAGGAFYANT